MKPEDPSRSPGEDLSGLERSLRALRRDVPPEDLAPSIAEGLSKLPPPRRPIARRLWAALQTPPVVWAYRVATLLVLLGILAGVWRAGARRGAVVVPPAPVSPVPAAARPAPAGVPAIPVTFTFYDPKAKSVCVVSSFNDWDPKKTPMTRGQDGSWTVQVSLPQGRYEYLFLVDGSRYETDPQAYEQRQDGMGNQNAVLRL
jgi:hypothetical protein